MIVSGVGAGFDPVKGVAGKFSINRPLEGVLYFLHGL